MVRIVGMAGPRRGSGGWSRIYSCCGGWRRINSCCGGWSRIHSGGWSRINSSRFDALLWEHARQTAGVEARPRCTFRHTVRDGAGAVIGVAAEDDEGQLEIRAWLSVGADGRFSAFARDVDAAIIEDHSERTSTVHYADWEGLAPFAPGHDHLASLCICGGGTTVLFFLAPRHRTPVVTHVRSDRVALEGDAERFDLDTLARHSGVRRRLDGARRVSPVLGLRRIRNRLLDPAGPGWALVGDALHHKDPIDGQGIYDTLLETALLDAHLEDLPGYRAGVIAATTPMLRATVRRLERELYGEPPAFVVATLLRWVLTDPEYQRRFLLFLSRAEPPETWPPTSLMWAAAGRGMGRDLRSLFRRRSAADG